MHTFVKSLPWLRKDGQTKTRTNEDWKPPYFWHRYRTWEGVHLVFFLVTVRWVAPTSMPFWFIVGFVYCLLSGLTFELVCRGVRRRWSFRALERMRDAAERVVETEADRILYTNTLLSIAFLLGRYTAASKDRNASVRLEPYNVDGFRFTFYRKGYSPTRHLIFPPSR